MKTIIFYLSIIFSASLLYSQSSIVYDAGTNIDIGTNADVCAATITVNGTYSGNGTFCNVPVDVEEEYKSEIPKEFNLSQNYPNPFNPSTVISYQLPVSSKVIIKVYDALGKEVRTLVNEEKPAGSYSVSFDATALSSGFYFYKITAGNFISTKKMILLR
jgi:hypothetical protein